MKLARKPSIAMQNEFISKKRDSTKTYTGMVYRTYSEVDLLEIQDIKNTLEKKEDMIYIDMETILSTYEGHTIFSIFQHYFEVYEKIYSQIREQEFKPESNVKKEEIENTALRRLHRILNMPTTDLQPGKPSIITIQPGCKFCLG